uniref:Uncharacterized protein n=1 Tax=Klebsiella pneumoniae TaxID=573 RepID=A0A6H1PSP4_KLEPN|nr:hypothetical protein [Klebsiella pneumoniae]
MLRTHNTGHTGFNYCGELADIEVAPFTMPVIVNGAGFPAGWTG